MVCHASGHLSTDLHAAFKADGVPLIQSDVEWAIFGDWYEMTGYDTDVRHELTKTVSKLRSRIASIYVLQRSKVVAMGIAVANLALGGWVRSTTSRAEFDRELETRVRDAARSVQQSV